MAYRITEEEYEEIKATEKKTKDKRQSRQLKVLMLRYEGKSNPEISKKLDISTDRISRACERKSVKSQRTEAFCDRIKKHRRLLQWRTRRRSTTSPSP